MRLKKIFSHGNVIILLALVAVSSIISDYFLTMENIINVVRVASVIGIVAIGMNVVIILAGIDLSVGSVVALTGAVSAGLWATGNPQYFIFIPLLVAILVGVINGGLVSWFNMQPFVATLIMMTVVRGTGLVYTGGQPVYADYPDWFSYIARGILFGLPVPTVLFIVITFVTWYMMRWRQIGREIYATGANETAAYLSGIAINKVKIKTYAFCALLAGISGLIMTARMGSGEPGQVGVFLELDAIAAVVIGGTSIRGGRGSIWGAVVGVLIISIVNNLFNLLGVGPAWQQVAKGSIIILAVILQSSSNDSLSLKQVINPMWQFVVSFVTHIPNIKTWFKPVSIILVVLIVVNGILYKSADSLFEVDFAKSPYREANNLELTRVYHRAMPLYQKIITDYPNSKYAILSKIGIANVLFKTGEFTDAKQQYQALLDDTNNPFLDVDTLYVVYKNYSNLLQEIADDETFETIYAIMEKKYPNSDAVKEGKVHLEQIKSAKSTDNDASKNAPVIIDVANVNVPAIAKMGTEYTMTIPISPNGNQSSDFSIMTAKGFWKYFKVIKIEPQPRSVSEFWGKQAWAYGQISAPIIIKATLKPIKAGNTKFDIDLEKFFDILEMQIVRPVKVEE